MSLATRKKKKKKKKKKDRRKTEEQKKEEEDEEEDKASLKTTIACYCGVFTKNYFHVSHLYLYAAYYAGPVKRNKTAAYL